MESSDIRIVLVAPSHPGNIGAAARAMKNMGLSTLVLVNPRQFPHPEASARASGADDVLQAACIVPSLAAALAGCGYVTATTARDRDQYFRVLDVRAAAARLVAESSRAPAAVVFGAERSGLSNEELEMAHALIRIPASPQYASLNLAMAVQVVAYELHRARAAQYREVIGLGGAGSEYDLLGPCANQRGHLRARPGNAGRGGAAKGMRRGRIAEVALGGQALAHRAGHAGVDRGRGGVIEVNGAQRCAPPAVRRRFCTAVRMPRSMFTSF